MSKMPRITLIFDPFGIWRQGGQRIDSLQSERQAFGEIDDLLRRDDRLETVVPKTYVVAANCVQHFKSYHGVAGVEIKNISPRSQVRSALREDLPEWLTDDMVIRWGLLEKRFPRSLSDQGWAATLAEWLLPGITDVASVDQWFRLVSENPENFGDCYGADPVSSWIQEHFASLAAQEITSREIVSELRAELTRAKTPAQFAIVWIKRKAYLPLTRAGEDNLLRVPSLASESPRARAVADQLPLLFPLPSPIHAEVSKAFCNALQRARIREKHRISESLKFLNAIWSGIPEEVANWLEVYPRGLTRQAAEHVEQLPGYDTSETLRKLITWYRPPSNVSPWPGLGGSIENWVSAYARYVRSCFLRRDISEKDDPAGEFGRWLKENPAVSFEHHQYSYLRVAQSVHSAIRSGRVVILVMIDAFPVHLAEDCIGYISDNFGEDPSRISCVFVPIPTITEVCKEAVLTGRLPKQCKGDLKSHLRERYELEDSEIQVAANWQDAERLQIEQESRLVVYRDNRLDDQLHKSASYRAMVEDSHGLFQRIANLVGRWKDDIKCVRHGAPLVIFTSDHGFTYGPTPGKETRGKRTLDGSHRCVQIDGDLLESDLGDESVTVIDKNEFRLRSTYLAARGRYFGLGTMSGWSMSHGGLLPEEVIVPYLEWFGDEDSLFLPDVEFPEGVVVDRDRLLLQISLKNRHPTDTPKGSLTIAVSGSESRCATQLPAVRAGQHAEVTIELSETRTPEGEKIPIDVIMESRQQKSGNIVQRQEQFLVPRARRLVEKTKEQADFEDMF